MIDFKNFLKDTERTQYTYFRQKTVNVCDFILKNCKFIKTEPTNKERAFYDLIPLAIMRMKAITNLLTKKFYNEAIICWRSLYEIECIIFLIMKSDMAVADEYYAFKSLKDVKTKVSEVGLNEIDIRRLGKERFKKYGWIWKINSNLHTNDINFQGLQKLSGVERKTDYKYSSEIVHSSKIIFDEEELFEFVLRNLCYSFINLFQIIDAMLDIKNDMAKEYILLLNSWIESN